MTLRERSHDHEQQPRPLGGSAPSDLRGAAERLLATAKKGGGLAAPARAMSVRKLPAASIRSRSSFAIVVPISAMSIRRVSLLERWWSIFSCESGRGESNCEPQSDNR